MPPPAMIKLYRAYREQAGRLSDLSDLLRARRPGDGAFRRPPADRRGARDRSSGGPIIFAAIEDEAEAFAAMLDPATICPAR